MLMRQRLSGCGARNGRHSQNSDRYHAQISEHYVLLNLEAGA
jgi:hypothetical protein